MPDHIDGMISQLEQKWIQDGQEVASEQIGLDVILSLKNLDQVAYIRFASVYMEFVNAEDFRKRMDENSY